jgi:hypothetical protein
MAFNKEMFYVAHTHMQSVNDYRTTILHSDSVIFPPTPLYSHNDDGVNISVLDIEMIEEEGLLQTLFCVHVLQ